jgi:AraC-like DNA-binding protein
MGGYPAGAFHHRFSCTAGAHVHGQRVALACRHLPASDAPLADVALLVGFANPSHFTGTGRCQIGFAPAVYRSLGHSRNLAGGPVFGVHSADRPRRGPFQKLNPEQDGMPAATVD